MLADYEFAVDWQRVNLDIEPARISMRERDTHSDRIGLHCSFVVGPVIDHEHNYRAHRGGIVYAAKVLDGLTTALGFPIVAVAIAS